MSGADWDARGDILTVCPRQNLPHTPAFLFPPSPPSHHHHPSPPLTTMFLVTPRNLHLFCFKCAIVSQGQLLCIDAANLGALLDGDPAARRELVGTPKNALDPSPLSLGAVSDDVTEDSSKLTLSSPSCVGCVSESTTSACVCDEAHLSSDHDRPSGSVLPCTNSFVPQVRNAASDCLRLVSRRCA